MSTKLQFRFGSVIAVVLLISGFGRATESDSWKPAPAPLMTRWAKSVRAGAPRPEYPRPLLVRAEWKSLNGLWEFAFDDWKPGQPMAEKILVPWTFEAALSGIGKGKEVHERVWYRRTFAVPRGWKDKRVLLHFGAVDWQTQVQVNGRVVGTHTGGYTPFSFDITDALKPDGGGNEIVVAVFDPADPKTTGWQPKGKQLGSEGIWYTRTTGIWQSVWLEPLNRENSLVAAPVTADPTRAEIVVQPVTRLPYSAGIPSAVVYGPNGKKVGEASASPILTIRVPEPKLWSPESPALYQVVVTLRDRRGKTLDTVRTYTAFRTYGIANGRLTLNGKPYFLRGVLDQGFWPDGIYTPPSDDAIRFDVEMTKRLGFNMARKHVKVEDPRWYYWCDKLGLVVWQDMPSSHNLSSDAAKQNFTDEWDAVRATVSGYPSVVHWIPFNENWGDPREFQDTIVTRTRQHDPIRPITDASGWTQRSLTDVVDAHDYSNSLKRQGVAAPVKPKVVGEYGGIALPIEGHTWTTGWGYQTVREPEGLIRRIRFQTSQLFDAPNLSGFVYTQLTDVEQELNGLMTYDRQPKADAARLAAVFSGVDRAPAATGYITNWLVLGPIATDTRLHSASDDPQTRTVFDKVLAKPYLPDEASLAPNANLLITTPDGQQRTWTLLKTDDDILDLQKQFNGQNTNAVAYAVAYVNSATEQKNVTLYFGSDDAAQVWLNGEPVWKTNRVRGVNLDEDVVPGLTLKAGQNVLVVKIAQGVGGWGVAARFDSPGK